MNDLPSNIAWLADAPLFIDADHINRFYDAVVKPETETGTTTIEINDSEARALKGKLALEGTASAGELIGKLTKLLPSLEIKASGEANAEGVTNSSEKIQVTLHPIKTPQRQLVQLSVHYLLNHPDRIFSVNNASEQDWRNPESIIESPRQLVFLNLPSQEQAHKQGLPETKIIPTAAEFENGKIELLYKSLDFSKQEKMPEYDNEGSSE